MYFQHSHKGEYVCVSVSVLRDVGINLANQQTKIKIKSGKSTKEIRDIYHERLLNINRYTVRGNSVVHNR